MSFFKGLASAAEKVPGLAQRLPEGLHHARDGIIGLWNPNRRHDDPEEIANDKVRQEINESHRFQSFAAEREGNFVKWHIDGHDYMWALSEMLDSAKDVIFILDWWLTPELYLRRPPAHYPEWRLDRILQRKAEQGVKVHIIVYKEVTQTVSMSSKHTKNYLESLHPNISCMRHPDHIGAKDSVEFWSHHEKVVVVDNHFACIGGLDLCFGRWDTHNHPLADVHPTDFSKTLFPGQDYNNARIMDFQAVYNYASNALSLLESPRMPWHDVHMTLTGPVVLDIVQHFTERWNEVKKRKYRNDDRYPTLALPHNIELSPNEAVVRHPHREQWASSGHHYRQRFHRWMGSSREDEEQLEPRFERPPNPTCRVQTCRSVSDWSHGVLTEHSIQNAYIQLIREANHFIYIENQFFISATKEGGVVVNLIAQALTERIIQAAKSGSKFKVVVVIPEVPGFAGNVKDEGSLKIIMAGQYRAMNRGGNSIYEKIREAGYEPLDYIRFYHLRSYDRINAPITSFIQKAEEQSGVKFSEAQVALARQWIGSQQTDQKEVTINKAAPTTQGLVASQDSNSKSGDQKPDTETVKIPESVEEATRTIESFERAAKGVRGDEDVSDSVAQHMLNDRTGLGDEKWLGDEQEELNSYVSELLYIHTKLMIVDDKRVIMGSANINDRSQKGDGDSEIALVVEDTDMIESQMDGNTVMVSRFAASLRRKLFREHLGLIRPQNCPPYPKPSFRHHASHHSSHREGSYAPSYGDSSNSGGGEANKEFSGSTDEDEVTGFMRPAPHPNPDEFDEENDKLVADPLSEKTLELWNGTAKVNTQVFTELFRPVPTNLVRSWGAYDNYVPKVKTGHVVPGVSLEVVKDRLSKVKGALVECPLDFLIDEKEFVEGPEWKGLNPTLPIYI